MGCFLGAFVLSQMFSSWCRGILITHSHLHFTLKHSSQGLVGIISRCLKWHPDLPRHVALVLVFSDSVCFRNCFFPQDNVALLRTDRFLSCLLTCRTVFTAELTFSKSCRWAKYENLSFIGQSFIHWKNLLLTISPLQTLSCMLGKYFLWLLWLLSWDQQLYR